MATMYALISGATAENPAQLTSARMSLATRARPRRNTSRCTTPALQRPRRPPSGPFRPGSSKAAATNSGSRDRRGPGSKSSSFIGSRRWRRRRSCITWSLSSSTQLVRPRRLRARRMRGNRSSCRSRRPPRGSRSPRRPACRQRPAPPPPSPPPPPRRRRARQPPRVSAMQSTRSRPTRGLSLITIHTRVREKKHAAFGVVLDLYLSTFADNEGVVFVKIGRDLSIYLLCRNF